MLRKGDGMHWLEGRLKELSKLAIRHPEYKSLAASNVPGSARAQHEASRALVAALRELVDQVTNRTGIEACFAFHEGLLVASEGESLEFEKLAAKAQSILDLGLEAAASLSLGEVHQLVLVCELRKLALITLGKMALGILTLSTVDIWDALEE
jgi:predicted regulator of Ras-like GTPase activity (Roadblock/LC7/MglB family)